MNENVKKFLEEAEKNEELKAKLAALSRVGFIWQRLILHR